MKVSLHPSIKSLQLRKGQEVILNEALNVIEAKGFDSQGALVRLKDVLEGGRALVTLHFDEEKVAELGDPLLVERLSVGDHLLYDPRSGYVIEKLPKSEAEDSSWKRCRMLIMNTLAASRKNWNRSAMR